MMNKGEQEYLKEVREIRKLINISTVDNSTKTLLKQLSDKQKIKEHVCDDFVSFLKNALLNEGLIKTYPLNNLEKQLCRYLNISSNNNMDNSCYGYISDQGDNSIIVTINKKNFNNEQKEALKKICKPCGYYVAKIEEENNTFDIQIEPIFEDSVAKSIIDNNDFLFHLTEAKNLNRIMQYGLVPSSKNNTLKYPDRSYLFTEKFLGPLLFHSEEIAKELYKDKNYNTNFIVLRIDIEGLANKKIFIDKNFNDGEGEAIYVTENISPQYITKIKEFNITK